MNNQRITTIELLIKKIGGTYCGLTAHGHLIKKKYQHPIKEYVSYQYFFESKCSLCGDTHFTRKWKLSSSHVECSARDVVKRRKPRKDRKVRNENYKRL